MPSKISTKIGLQMCRIWLRLGVPELALRRIGHAQDDEHQVLHERATARADSRHRKLAAQAAALGDIALAEEHVSASIAAGTATKWTWLWKARYEARLQRHDDARRSIDEALRLDPSFEQAQVMVASFDRAKGLSGR